VGAGRVGEAITKRPLLTGTSVSRQSFVARAGAAGFAVGTLGLPAIVRAASRRIVTHGVQSGDVTMSSGVV